MNIPSSFLQYANCNYLLQKEIVLLTICLYSSNWEKVPFLSRSPIFIQKEPNYWATLEWLLGFPKPFSLPLYFLLSAHDSRNTLHFRLILVTDKRFPNLDFYRHQFCLFFICPFLVHIDFRKTMFVTLPSTLLSFIPQLCLLTAVIWEILLSPSPKLNN